jgi:predicted ester cyclase
MSTEDNIALVRRWREEVYNQKHLAAYDECFDPKCVDHAFPLGQQGNLEEIKHFTGTFLAAFPDLHSTIEDIFAVGDKVAFRFSSIGTQQGTFMEIPPTGKQVTFRSIDIVRIAGGKIVEHWHETDALGVLVQLGVVPPPGQGSQWIRSQLGTH